MTSTIWRIVHPVHACGDCAGTDAQLYHFGRNDGANVSIAHGCAHYIRDSYPGNPPPAEWLANRAVQPGAECTPARPTTQPKE